MIRSLMRPVRIGWILGDSLWERLTLTLFLYTLYLPNHPKGKREFRIRVYGVSYDISLTHSRTELYALQDALIDSPYTKKLPVAAPQVIFDLGANIGYVSMLFAALYPDSVIHAFEPDPENFKRLQVHVAGSPNIRCHQYAIGGTTGELVLHVSDAFPMRHSLLERPDTRAVHVPVLTLHDAMKDVGTEHVDILKFDIEGAEADMFAPFEEWHRIGFLTGEIHTKLLGERAATLLETLKESYDLTIEPAGAYSMVRGPLRV